MSCTNTYDTGDSVVVSWVAACGDDIPLFSEATPLVFAKVGSTTTKAFGLELGTTSVKTDDSGKFDDNIINNYGADHSFSGFLRPDAVDQVSQQALITYIEGEVAANRQPTAWLRFTDPMTTKHYYRFVLFTGYSKPMANDDARSIDFSCQLQATRVSTNSPIQEEAIV
jgi:hypothetical protein